MADEGVAKRIFDNLLNIEVNTIVKAGMTGRKMPVVGQALLDIFGEYDTWLSDCSGRLERAVGRLPPRAGMQAYRGELRRQQQGSRIVTSSGPIQQLSATTRYDPSKVTSSDDFRSLRDQAATALEMHQAMSRHGVALKMSDANMLRRIVRNCAQLVAILEKPGLAPATGMELSRGAQSGIQNGPDATAFSADDVVTIRKAWELGTEDILMQTVVQLDGDAVTRINEAYTSASDQPLRDVHQQGVETALGQWNSLVNTFLTVFRELGSFLGGLVTS